MTPAWKPGWMRPRPWWHWFVAVLLLAYLVYAVGTIPFDLDRVQRGAERSLRFLGEFLRPDFASRWSAIRAGVVESLTMTLVATVIGVLLSIPVALAAASNIAPKWLYNVSRFLLAVLRSFPEVIIAILFVVMMGFGPVAGVITLLGSTLAFLGKILAEAIEEIDHKQVEAVRATGASPLQVIRVAIVPQIMPRFAGLAVYRLDINFRESTILGIVGAGGIGGTLRTSIQRYDFDTSAAVLIIVIAIVLALEYMSGFVRSRVQ